ncbi:MAG: TraR/DksA C4-type zinc finger protein [Firmicutes bacterium]|nr:TraR/DksA C4-type zinc finger protein [Bacillota bacterium]MDH7496442.1 TraR/DksA C4-type zinc finger protein [Bacillota bacterium]
MERRLQQAFLARLLEERSRLESRIGALEGRGGQGGLDTSMRDSIGEFSLYDNHPADVGSELFERAKDLKFRDDARLLLKLIDEAIERVRSGVYGTCERCGREIGEERLEMVPYTAVCARCKEQVEKEIPARRVRPIEEEAIGRPFGPHILDGKSPGIDGEDVWQDVARYGTSSTPQDVPGAEEYGEAFDDADEVEGAVERVDLIMAEDPDEIPPDPDAPRRRP